MNTQNFFRFFRWSLIIFCAGLFLANSHIAAGLTAPNSSLNGGSQNFIYLPIVTNPVPPVIVPDATACKLPEATNYYGGVGTGFPLNPVRLASTGTVRAKVIFVDFSDVTATQTPEEVYSFISPESVDLYSAFSNGAMNLQLEPYFVWLRMSKPSTDYGFPFNSDAHYEYIQEAVTLADPNVDFTGVEMVYVMTTPNASAIGWGPTYTGFQGITADGNTWYNGVTSGEDLLNWEYKWLNHETGHSMGLVDLYAYSGDPHRFVGGFDLMGLISGQGPEFLAYQRWLLGWLTDTQIYCQQTPDETIYLTAIEVPGGIKTVMVPTGPTSLVAIESRRALGYDNQLTETSVLVYTVDTSILSGNGPIKVLPDNSTMKYDSPLGVGEQLIVGNVTIEVLQAGPNGDTVRVTITP